MARVLVVGLDPRVRSFFRRIISPAGHEVAVAATGSEGIRLLSSYAFDLVFVDMGMGAATALEVIVEARERGGNFPVVAVATAGPDGLELFNPMAFGAIGVIERPYNADEIRSVVAVHTWHARSQARTDESERPFA